MLPATGVLSAWPSRSLPPTTSSEPSLVKTSRFTRDLHCSEVKGGYLQSLLDRSIRCCPCGRRHLLGASASVVLLSDPRKKMANSLALDSDTHMQKFRSARPDWYDELFAKSMEEGMRSYEAAIAGYKAELFSLFTETSEKVLELGVGTGPNFKYYARAADLYIVGIDPNKQMEKYARGAAVAAGLPKMNFTFIEGIGEHLPVEDGSFDVVIGTLVLCSVKDVNRTLQGWSLLRFTQSILDPFQQFVADGCHLTRETGEQISHAGFSTLNLKMADVHTVSIISPHVYGMACK